MEGTISVLTSKDFLAGLVAFGFGAFVAWYGSGYSFGSPQRMGPGFFPISLGVVLALVGLAIMAAALKEHEALPMFNLRPWAVIPLTILVFALLLPRVGFGPAGLTTVLATGLAERRASFLARGVLALVIVPAAWLLFSKVLGVPLPFLMWSM